MEQFKTLEDLRDYVKSLSSFYARPTEVDAHPTLYVGNTNNGVIQGIRKRDYLFSSDEKWVLPHEQMGLSFSAHWQHLKRIYRLKQKVTAGKPIDVYWVLEKVDVPSGLAFVPDVKDKKHYLLIVTTRMGVDELVRKLTWVADRMSVIRSVKKVL
ncbi:hypothetical protein [Aliikangiella sp. IMCC44359]|uniref:hypothetical protein n=1 Tax=Aliikangiella sp. IMCC44359 TaxID=3459125 RepID=UPI00403A9E20